VNALDTWGYRTFRYAEIIGTPQAMTVGNTAVSGDTAEAL
jgi:hypothetical protein